ncbi:MAG: dTMP kinase [Bryobacteraceae bacterium]
MRGRGALFITFEGTEGSGKSTQMQLLAGHLRETGFTVVENQEPGATSIGKQIRRILLDPAHQELTAMTELLLMFASRTQAAAEIIIPALEVGNTVVSDRFTDSTLAYQGEARGLGFETVLTTHQLALGSLMPDLTICIRIDVETGLARAENRNVRRPEDAIEARLDRQSLEFHRRVSEGYERIARLEPERFRLVDGEGDRATVAERVWAEVSRVIDRK